MRLHPSAKAPLVKIVIVSVRPAWATALRHSLESQSHEVNLVPSTQLTAMAADLIVVDCVQLPRAREALRTCLAVAPTARLLALVGRASDYLAQKLRQLGVHGVLSEADDWDAWLFMLGRITTRYFQTGPSFVSAHAFAQHLTPRQAQVYEGVLRGFCDETIAEQLGITVTTAETHRRDLQAKLDCHSHQEVVLHALRLGVIDAVDLPRTTQRQASRQRASAA